MIGLERGRVMLCDHESEWDIEAQNTIARLRDILGDIAIDIQHVGSTSIKSIKAKPIIDIAVAVDNFDDIMQHSAELLRHGFHYCPHNDTNWQCLFACGSYYDGTGNMQTHFIHVVLFDSDEWINYINFRNYLNKNYSAARDYEKLKLSLAEKYCDNADRKQYTAGKHDFITHILKKALAES